MFLHIFFLHYQTDLFSVLFLFPLHLQFLHGSGCGSGSRPSGHEQPGFGSQRPRAAKGVLLYTVAGACPKYGAVPHGVTCGCGPAGKRALQQRMDWPVFEEKWWLCGAVVRGVRQPLGE